jgi:hypothetical protein
VIIAANGDRYVANTGIVLQHKVILLHIKPQCSYHNTAVNHISICTDPVPRPMQTIVTFPTQLPTQSPSTVLNLNPFSRFKDEYIL